MGGVWFSADLMQLLMLSTTQQCGYLQVHNLYKGHRTDMEGLVGHTGPLDYLGNTIVTKSSRCQKCTFCLFFKAQELAWHCV